MRFKEFFRWIPDNHEESTEAVVVVSECGSVIKRLPYVKWNVKNNGYDKMKEHVYKQSSNRGKDRLKDTENKYLNVSIGKGKIRKTYASHRVVALSWIPNPQNKEQVNHKNGIKNDNRVANLEWVTNHENLKHKIENGLDRYAVKVNSSVVEKMAKLRNEGLSIDKIGELFGVTGETVRTRTLSSGLCTRRMRAYVTEEEKNSIVKMRADGAKLKEIGFVFDISESCVSQICRKYAL